MLSIFVEFCKASDTIPQDVRLKGTGPRDLGTVGTWSEGPENLAHESRTIEALFS